MEAVIRRLGPQDAEKYVAVRRAMLTDSPLAFLSSPDDDFSSDVAVVRQRLGGPDHWTFGAFVGNNLVGAVGVYREQRLKAAHRMNVWGMFVTPEARGQGIRRALLKAVIAHASGVPGVTQVTLCVTDAAWAARRLYASLGFEVWGTEPRALAVDGRVVDDHHMVLFLDPTHRAPPDAPAVSPAETVRTGIVRVALPPDEALPLFTAPGEVLWAPGWSPTYVSPPDGRPVDGGVWLTRDGDQEVIWRVQRYDVRARVAEYLRVVPGNRVVVVRVQCEAEGAATRARVTYRVTPIGPAGHAWLDAFDDEAYAAMMREWEDLLAAYLAR